MNAVAKTQIESGLAERFGRLFDRREKPLPEILPTGITEIDHSLGGFPRGAITEIHGSASSGRTSLLLSALASATSADETCALVDCSDTFDLSSGIKAGVSFDRLLWVRCNDNLERAFKAVDLLLHSGGFGFIVLNLADIPAKTLRRIISTWWFRFRRALENTPTVLIVTTPMTCLRSCASVVLQLKNERAVWPNALGLIAEPKCALTATKQRSQPHMSLVAAPPASAFAVGHSHFIQGLSIRVVRERPFEWSDRAITFTSHH